jgi:hypothetical protein
MHTDEELAYVTANICPRHYYVCALMLAYICTQFNQLVLSMSLRLPTTLIYLAVVWRVYASSRGSI